MDRTIYLPFILAPGLWPGFHSRLDRYTQLLTQLYGAVQQVSGAEVVVDSTKRPSLAYILRSARDIDLRLLHVVRDPRGVVYSWSRQVALPQGAGPRPYMLKRSALLISRRWLMVNAMIDALAALRVPSALLRRCLPHCGGLHLASSHAVAGGRVRFQTGGLELRLDEARRERLSAPKRRFVELVSWPLRRRYGYR